MESAKFSANPTDTLTLGGPVCWGWFQLGLRHKNHLVTSGEHHGLALKQLFWSPRSKMETYLWKIAHFGRHKNRWSTQKKTPCFDATKTGGNVPRCPKKHPVARHKLQSMVWKLCWLNNSSMCVQNGCPCTKQDSDLHLLLFPLIITFSHTYITLDLLLLARLTRG